MHQQDAYIVDQGALGDLDAIGWDKPTSAYFGYDYSAGVWTATPTTKGPTCSTPWKVKSSIEDHKGKHVPDGGCDNLTPNFKSIGSSAAAPAAGG